MQKHMRKLLTIVAEAALESHLVRDLEQLGAKGYTISDARGKGRHGVRSSAWDASSNIRIEVVCEPDLADVIAGHLQAHYYDDYAMITYLTDVAVLRPDKF